MSRLQLVVAAVDDTVPGVRSLTLRATDSRPTLPSFVPGSHLVLECGDRANAYSLTSESVCPQEYTISVLRLADGAGGSRWLHDQVAVGDPVTARVPQSAFAPVARATKHLLIAGGIGVTPVISHLRAAAVWGRDVQVLYAYREGRGAHVDELKELAGDHVEFFTDRTGFLERLDRVLTEQPLGAHLYVCGPGPMIDRVTETAVRQGWPASRIHAERFGIDALDPGEPFRVILTASGTEVAVPSGTSLLEALEAAGHAIPNRCRQGVCGECRIPVSAGTPVHRDLYLTDDEKAAGDALMCCVSRAVGPGLEVPL